MAELLSDELRGVIEPHLPKRKRRALTGIVFVLRCGLPWGDLPKELGSASVAGGGWWPGRRR